MTGFQPRQMFKKKEETEIEYLKYIKMLVLSDPEIINYINLLFNQSTWKFIIYYLICKDKPEDPSNKLQNEDHRQEDAKL